MRGTTTAIIIVACLWASAWGEALCGDAGEDGVLSVIDALAAAQHAVGVIVLPASGVVLADVDLSGTVDVLDALKIAQKAAGLMVTLTCGAVWVELVTATAPPGREDGGLVFDSVRNEVVYFGGANNTFPPFFGDTWTWNGSTWAQEFPPSSPSPRTGVGMAFDAARGVTVLFGGSDNSTIYDDTWTWDGSTWTERMPATVPPGRSGQIQVYDALRQETVLYGGSYGSSSYRDDTWTWDGTDWTLETPVTSPSGRTVASAAWDPGRNTVVMFGGQGNVLDPGTYTDETWEWDGTNWTLLTPAVSPGPRLDGALAHDPGRGVLVYFGGRGSGAVLLNETWHWTGSNWEQPLVAISPIERWGCRAVFDPQVGAVLLHGGRDPFVRFPDDTWIY